MNRLWESSCGRLTLRFTKRECDSVPEFGSADDAIDKLLQSKRILQQFALVSDNLIIDILQEFGAWSDDLRIVTRKTNIGRLLWVAIMDLREAY